MNSLAHAAEGKQFALTCKGCECPPVAEEKHEHFMTDISPTRPKHVNGVNPNELAEEKQCCKKCNHFSGSHWCTCHGPKEYFPHTAPVEEKHDQQGQPMPFEYAPHTAPSDWEKELMIEFDKLQRLFLHGKYHSTQFNKWFSEVALTQARLQERKDTLESVRGWAENRPVSLQTYGQALKDLLTHLTTLEHE